MKGDTAFLWTTLAEGRWTTAELRERHPRMTRLESLLAGMVDRGLVTRYEGAPVKFGITNDCTVPVSLTVGELLSLLGGKT